MPLGGEHEVETPPESGPAAAVASARPVSSAAEKADERAADAAEVVPVQAPAAAASVAPVTASESPKPAASGAFQLRPYASGQSWTRVFDAEFDMKLGPTQNVDMRMVNHQEARFEVVAASAGNLEKLAIEYTVDTAKMTVMGREQNEPQVLAGKRYLITFVQGKPEVKTSGGGAPSKKELDSVKDDAREPLAMETALKELAGLTPKARGDFSSAGAIALAGGEDDDTHIRAAKASLQQVTSGAGGTRSALIDLAYSLTSTADPDMIIELQLTGSMTVLDAPARYQTVTVSGPMTLRPSQAAGMEGRGNGKVTVSYRY